MKGIQISRLATAISMIGLAACDSTSATPSLLSDSTVTTDVAISAGDAIASAIEGMVANEGSASLSVTNANVANAVTNTLTFSRTRTCYNAAGTVVAGCTPLSSVRKIVSHVTADGSRSGNHETTGGSPRTFTGVVHRISDDTLVRNFNTAQPPVEISRTHSGLTLGNDTTTFTEGDLTRVASEATRDTVKAVTWNLPRSSNPWPVSGSIVRAVTVRVVVTRGTRTETRNYTRRVQVTFPADAQGNVVMTVNDRTCNLNLVTRVVSNCT